MSKTTSDKPDRTALEVATGISRALLLATEAQVAQMDPATAPIELIESLMKLGQRASDLLAECRKLEKAQGQLAQGLTRELVLAWAKQQTRETRVRLQEDLIRLNDKRATGSVLA